MLFAVVVEPEVSDEVFAHDVTERVLQLDVLNEEVMLRVDARCRVRVFEVKAEPLLNAETTQ